MLIAKIIEKRGNEVVSKFREVMKVGTVQFDPRDNWVLLSSPIGARPRKRDLEWVHPSETDIEWIRPFNFGENKWITK